jgi:hypothetical protein
MAGPQRRLQASGIAHLQQFGQSRLSFGEDGPQAQSKQIGDPRRSMTSAKGLTDFIASRVKNEAVDQNGNIIPSALAKIKSDYANPLFRFSKSNKQLTDVEEAQGMVNHYTAQQRLVDTLQNGLGTEKGSGLYSANGFNKFLNDPRNAADIETAYSEQGVKTLNKINQQLQNFEATASARAPRTSGTAQTINSSHIESAEGNMLGAIIGENAGDLVSALPGFAGMPPGLVKLNGTASPWGRRHRLRVAGEAIVCVATGWSRLR